MHPRTHSTLAELDLADWFSRVGHKDSEAVIVLPSWEQAINSCKSPEWQDLYLEAANRYREQLAARAPDQFARWNEIVREVKKYSIPLVEKKAAAVTSAHKLPKVFIDCVQWDVLHGCMEAEYADIFPPGYFASQLYWYVKGHFPCGWNGRFPEGKLVIY